MKDDVGGSSRVDFVVGSERCYRRSPGLILFKNADEIKSTRRGRPCGGDKHTSCTSGICNRIVYRVVRDVVYPDKPSFIRFSKDIGVEGLVDIMCRYYEGVGKRISARMHNIFCRVESNLNQAAKLRNGSRNGNTIPYLIIK